MLDHEAAIGHPPGQNLCPASLYTGWDPDGGYAEYTTVRTDFAHRLPGGYSDAEPALLLRAGIIGYRALRRASLPPRRPAGHLRLRRVGAPHRAGGRLIH